MEGNTCLDHEKRISRLENSNGRGTIHDIQAAIGEQRSEMAAVTTSLSTLKDLPLQVVEIRERLARLEGLKWLVPAAVGVAGSVFSSLIVQGIMPR